MQKIMCIISDPYRQRQTPLSGNTASIAYWLAFSAFRYGIIFMLTPNFVHKKGGLETMKKCFVILIFVSLCVIRSAEAYYEGFFGNLDKVQIAGTIKAQNHYDRYIDFKINKGVLSGTVTAEHYSPRALQLHFVPDSITGSISGAANFYERSISFSVSDRHISGSFTTEELAPRMLEIEVGDNTIEGTVSTERYTPRHIRFTIDEKGQITGSVTSEGWNTRFINMTYKEGKLTGTIQEKSAYDRLINLTISPDDSDTVKLALFCLLMDVQMRKKGMMDEEYTPLNLNLNLNLP